MGHLYHSKLLNNQRVPDHYGCAIVLVRLRKSSEKWTRKWVGLLLSIFWTYLVLMRDLHGYAWMNSNQALDCPCLLFWSTHVARNGTQEMNRAGSSLPWSLARWEPQKWPMVCFGLTKSGAFLNMGMSQNHAKLISRSGIHIHQRCGSAFYQAFEPIERWVITILNG